MFSILTFSIREKTRSNRLSEVIMRYLQLSLVVLLLATTAIATENDAAPDCKVDADCQPSSCCHATHCVAASTLKDRCEDTMCPAQCLPFTLDCGGRCRCSNGKCGAILRQGVPPAGGPTRIPPPAKGRRTIIVRVPARK